MSGQLPPNPGGGPAIPPALGQGERTYPSQPASRPRTWPAITLAAVALAVAIAALVVAFTRFTSAPPTPKVPAYTAAQATAAQQRLCDTYKLAAHAVQVETTGTDRALARIALTNGAIMLDNGAIAPALTANQRDTARALATAYAATTAMGSIATDAEYEAALEDIVAKDAAMKKVCGDW